MRLQGLGRHGLGRLQITQAGDAVGLVRAHSCQQLPDCVAALVIDPGGNGVTEVLPLPLDKGGQELPVRCPAGGKEQLRQEVRHGGEHRHGVRRELVFDKIGVESARDDIASLAYQGAEAGAVAVVKMGGDIPDCRVMLGAAQQYAGQQRID